MRITSKGQVTIPVAIREKAGLMPNSEVEFVMAGNVVTLIPAKSERRDAISRGDAIVRQLEAAAPYRFTTEEVMAMTRGED